LPAINSYTCLPVVGSLNHPSTCCGRLARLTQPFYYNLSVDWPLFMPPMCFSLPV
jgi:hypothetical protein